MASIQLRSLVLEKIDWPFLAFWPLSTQDNNNNYAHILTQLTNSNFMSFVILSTKVCVLFQVIPPSCYVYLWLSMSIARRENLSAQHLRGVKNVDVDLLMGCNQISDLQCPVTTGIDFMLFFFTFCDAVKLELAYNSKWKKTRKVSVWMVDCQDISHIIY